MNGLCEHGRVYGDGTEGLCLDAGDNQSALFTFDLRVFQVDIPQWVNAGNSIIAAVTATASTSTSNALVVSQFVLADVLPYINRANNIVTEHPLRPRTAPANSSSHLFFVISPLIYLSMTAAEHDGL